MQEIVTYVEMTTPSQLVPAAPVPGLGPEPVDRSALFIPRVMAGIGAPHGWRSASRTTDDWDAWFAEYPDRKFWLLSFEGEPAGIVTYDLHPGGNAEIVTFGLLPEFVGRGLGGFALTLGVRQAWALAPSVSRVWLHTSSKDHPRALTNYHRRGFRTFRTEERSGGHLFVRPRRRRGSRTGRRGEDGVGSDTPRASRCANMSCADSCAVPRPAEISSSASRSRASHSG